MLHFHRCSSNLFRSYAHKLIKTLSNVKHSTANVECCPLTPEVINRDLDTERNLGLSEFVGKQTYQFFGLIKYRHEDFVVHEIDPNGRLVSLESKDAPEGIEMEDSNVKEEQIEKYSTNLSSTLLDDIRVYSEKYISTPSPSSPPSPILIPTEGFTKWERFKIHAFIEQSFPNLCTNSAVINDKSYIKVSAVDGKNVRHQPKPKWPKDKPPYINFVLYKENMETLQAIYCLARQLRCSPRNFAFAGSKDKRAISTQRLAAYKIDPALIWKAARECNKWGRRFTMHVNHFENTDHPIKLGYLKGNQFEIVLRNIHSTPSSTISNGDFRSIVNQSLETVKETGFVNYFGMQRFQGEQYKLGSLILKQDFKQLVHEILLCQSHPCFREVIDLLESGDALAAFRKIPPVFYVETSLLRALIERIATNDYEGALLFGMVRNQRMLYLNSYQSYLWNQIVTYRIQQYGLQVVEGDLVFVEEPDNEFKIKRGTIPRDLVTLVTANNKSQFSIFDVVLPVVGADTKLPPNRVASFIESLLAQDGLGVEDFGLLPHKWRSNGSYRKILARPEGLEWQWIHLSDDSPPVIETDLDRLKGQKRKTTQKSSENSDLTDPTAVNSLRLKFTLPASSYATMFLRELTKLSSVSLTNGWQLYHANETDSITSPSMEQVRQTGLASK